MSLHLSSPQSQSKPRIAGHACSAWPEYDGWMGSLLRIRYDGMPTKFTDLFSVIQRSYTNPVPAEILKIAHWGLSWRQRTQVWSGTGMWFWSGLSLFFGSIRLWSPLRTFLPVPGFCPWHMGQVHLQVQHPLNIPFLPPLSLVPIRLPTLTTRKPSIRSLPVLDTKPPMSTRHPRASRLLWTWLESRAMSMGWMWIHWTSRLNIRLRIDWISIVPTHVDASNISWYFLNEDVVPRSKSSSNASATHSDLAVKWSNDPSFNFKVI